MLTTVHHAGDELAKKCGSLHVKITGFGDFPICLPQIEKFFHLLHKKGCELFYLIRLPSDTLRLFIHGVMCEKRRLKSEDPYEHDQQDLDDFYPEALSAMNNTMRQAGMSETAIDQRNLMIVTGLDATHELESPVTVDFLKSIPMVLTFK